MSFLAKTYSCGKSGGVRKLTNLAGSWVNVSLPIFGIPGATNGSLFDIAVDPTNGDKVFTVGEGYCSNQAFNWFGIAVSSSGGGSWQVPSGNYQNVVNENCYHKWIEVSVVDTNTIYVCGIVDTTTQRGTIAKSTDGGLTFNMCALLPSVLINQDCTSIHFTSPLVGVVGLNNYVVKTIDGGITWSVMNGGQALSTSNPSTGTILPIGPITGIYISSDESYILAVGLDFIVETLPYPSPVFTAGVIVDSWQKNFYTNPGFGVPIGLHVTSLPQAIGCSNTGDYISVTGSAELGIYTGDKGVSWTTNPPPGYQPSGIGFTRRAAHFYKPAPFPSSCNTQAGFYSKDFQLFSNPTSFDPNVEVLSDTAPYIINSVWTWYEEQLPICYKLIACDGTSIITSTDMSAYLSPAVYFHIGGDSRCYHAEYATDCTGALPVTVTGANYLSCNECNPQITCYTLNACDGSASIITNTDMSAYLSPTLYFHIIGDSRCFYATYANECIGAVAITVTGLTYASCNDCNPPISCFILTDCSKQFPTIITNTDLTQYLNHIIQLDTFPGVCWQVDTTLNCTVSPPLTGVVISVFDNCVACLTKCYKLTDCLGIADVIITDIDLSLYLNQVVKILSQPNVCWLVTLSDTCLESTTIQVSTSFVSCALCLALPDIPFIPLKTRSVQPGYGVGLCSVDYVEKINCAFADQVYSKFITKKYGVTQCIEDEFDKYLVKKSILDLNLIYDPNACMIPCPVEICAEVIIVPPVPILCMGPSEVTTEIVFQPLPCPAPSILSTEIVYQNPNE